MPAFTIEIKVFLVERFGRPQIWRLEIPACDPVDAARLAFHISNAPPDCLTEIEAAILSRFPRTRLRSVSVGDILLIQDAQIPGLRHIATVDSVGFTFH